MGNIIGEPFLDYVRTQVKTRQEVLGSEYLNSDDLKYITTKTPWLRLASSVDLTANEISGSIDPNSVLGKLVANGVNLNWPISSSFDWTRCDSNYESCSVAVGNTPGEQS